MDVADDTSLLAITAISSAASISADCSSKIASSVVSDSGNSVSASKSVSRSVSTSISSDTASLSVSLSTTVVCCSSALLSAISVLADTILGNVNARTSANAIIFFFIDFPLFLSLKYNPYTTNLPNRS